MAAENKRWYAMPADYVAERLNTNTDTGLSESEAAKRLKIAGENDIFPVKSASLKSCIKKVTLDPVSVLLVLSCALSAFFGNLAVFVAVLSAVVFNYAVLVVIYTKSEQIFSKINENVLPPSNVLRDDRIAVVRQKDIVPGDIILIKAGQIVPADARLVESDRLIVTETGITEAVGSVMKNADSYDARVKEPHECSNMVFAATVVASGRGKAIVTETGKNTIIGAKERGKSSSHERPDSLKMLSTLSYIAGLALVVIVALLTVINILAGSYGALDGFIIILAYGAAFMSESYALFGSVSVAAGVYGSLDTNDNLLHGSLIKNTARLDALKDVTALMIPCESVYSEQNMRLDKMYVHGKLLDFASGGLSDDEMYRLTPEERKVVIREKHTLLIQALISTGNYTAQRVRLKNERGDIYTYEENAIIKAAADAGVYNVILDREYPIIGHAGLDEAPFETTLISWYGENRIFLRGDVSDILAVCTDYATGHDNKTEHISPVVRRNIETIARQMMRQSQRVIAVASGPSKYKTLIKISELYHDLVFEGLICFDEPVLPGAAYSVKRCREAGIRPVLFSEKEDERSLMLASTLGIVNEKNGDVIMTASEARKMDTDIFVTELTHCNLFCGFNAAERRKIIHVLRERGEKVAYLGRGNEDIIISREADVAVTQVASVTLGRGADYSELVSDGCDAMRFCADVIVSSVSDDGSGGFNALVKAVATAKNIFKNISAWMCYLIFTGCFRTAAVLASVFAPSGSVFISTVQTVISGLIIDLAAVLTIIFTAPEKDALSYKSRTRKMPVSGRSAYVSVLAGFSAFLITLITSLIFSRFTSEKQTFILSFSFVSLVLCSLIFMLEAKKKSSLFTGGISIGRTEAATVILTAAFLVLSYLFTPVGALFGISHVSLLLFLPVLIPPVILLAASEIYKAVERSKVKKHS